MSTSTNRPTTLRSLGFNAKYDPTSQLTLSFDSSYSQAKDNDGGKTDFAVIGFNEPLSYSALGSGLPSITAANGFTNPSVGMAHYASEQGSNVVDTIYEQKFDGVYKTEFETFTAVRFGGIYENHTKTNQLVESNRTVACLYCGYSTGSRRHPAALQPQQLPERHGRQLPPPVAGLQSQIRCSPP